MGRLKETGFPVTIIRPSHTYSRAWIPNPISSASYSFAARLEAGKPVFVPDDGENPWTLTAASDFAVGLAGLVGNQQAIGESRPHHERRGFDMESNLRRNCLRLECGMRQRFSKFLLNSSAARFRKLLGNLKGDKSHPGVFDNSKIKRLVPDFECRKPFRIGIRGIGAMAAETSGTKGTQSTSG